MRTLTYQWRGHHSANYSLTVYKDKLIQNWGNRCFALGVVIKHMNMDNDGLSYYILDIEPVPAWWSYA